METSTEGRARDTHDSSAKETWEGPATLPTAGLTEEQLSLPNPARMYDYYLGGHHNLAIDRKAADQGTRIYPEFPLVMRVNRAFLRRSIQFLVAQGIKRFLDIGSGIPTVGNVHQIAQQAEPNARVVYVDIDPVAVAHSTAMLRHNPRACIVRADMREPELLLNMPPVRDLLALGEPVGLILAAVLHFIVDDDQARQVVFTLRDALPKGSYVVISHATYEDIPGDVAPRLVRLYGSTSQPMKTRSRADIARFFEGLEMVEPGVVSVPLWHPEYRGDLFLSAPERSLIFAGVGRKT